MTFLDYLIQEESDALNEYIGNRNPKDNGVIFPLVGYIFDKKLFQNKKMTKTDFAKVVKEESEKNKDSMKFSLGALSTINKLLSFKDSEDVNKEDNLIKAIARIIKQYKIN